MNGTVTEEQLRDFRINNGIGAAILADIFLTKGRASQFLFIVLPAANLIEHNKPKNIEQKIAQQQRFNENFTSVVTGLGFNYAFGKFATLLTSVRKTFNPALYESIAIEGTDLVKYYYNGVEFGESRWFGLNGTTISLNIPIEYQNLGLGAKAFQEAVQEADKFTAIWVRSGIYEGTTTTGSSVNLVKYQQGVAKKLSPEKAAWKTWSGQQAKKAGFKKVKVENRVDGRGVDATFTR